MREKRLQLIITFHSTAGAMAMDKLCRQSGLKGRLIPVPRQISAGCGMAWCAPVEERHRLRDAVGAAGLNVDDYYEMMV